MSIIPTPFGSGGAEDNPDYIAATDPPSGPKGIAEEHVKDADMIRAIEDRVVADEAARPSPAAGLSPFPLVSVNPGDSWAAALIANPTAKTLVIKAGLHTSQFITVNPGTNDNLTLLFEPGAIADGGAVIRTIPDAHVTAGSGVITSAGNHFLPTDFSASTPTIIWGGPGYQANCGGQTTVYTNTGSVTVGDTALSTATFTATLVRPSVAGCGYIIRGTAKNIRMIGGEIRNYAVELNRSAIFPQNGDSPSAFADWGMRWEIRNALIHDNSNQAIRTCHGCKYVDNLIYNNGDMGIGGTGLAPLIQGNEIYNNNAYLNNVGFDAAAIKLALCTGARIIDNIVHDNNGGCGIWFDVGCSNFLVEGNICYRNAVGVFSEISTNGKIFRNICWDNGTAGAGSIYTGGGNIVISSSMDVEVAWNDAGLFNTGAYNGIVCLFQNRIMEMTTVTITDGVFNGTTTMTSATAKFDTSFEGAYLTGPGGITTTTYIKTVNSATSVTMNQTVASATGQTVNIEKPYTIYGTPGEGLGQLNAFHQMWNVQIHSNNIACIGNAFVAGMSTDVTNSTSMFTQLRVKYWNNSYKVDPSAGVFAWDNGAQNEAYWKTTAAMDPETTSTTPTPSQIGPNGAYTLDATTTYLTAAAATA